MTKNSFPVSLLIPGLLILIFTNSLCAQGGDSFRYPGWEFSFKSGFIMGKTASQLETAMRLNDLDHDGSTALFGSGGQIVKYPHTRKGITWSLETNRQIIPNIFIGMNLTFANYGETVGKGPYGHILSLSYSATSLSPLFHYKIDNWLSFGVGPSFIFVSHKMNFKPEPPGTFAIGGVLSTSLYFPAKSRVYGLFSLQYSWLGRQYAGPYEIGINAPTTFFPKTGFTLNYFYIGLGVGVRIFKHH